MPLALRAFSSGSSSVVNQKITAVTTSAMAQTWATICQPNATRTNGAVNLVTAAPTLPAPKIPRAVPCFSFGYHFDT